MAAKFAPLLDGNDGSLSLTLGLGPPIHGSFISGESKLILGRQIREPSLFSRAFLSPVATAAVFVSNYSGGEGGSSSGGAGDGGGDGGGDGEGG